MSTQAIRDYLTKQLLIEKNIVTYRSLSRVLALNVNVAKNELAEFHANDGQGSAATYLLSGETRTRPDEDVDMDDNPYVEEDDEEEYVPQTEIILVTEGELESAQAQFITLDSIHVYSLSPSVIRDAGLLCTPTEIVRSLDTKKGAELAAVVGKVISADVNISSKSLPTWGGRKAPPPVAGPSKIKKEEETKVKEKEKPKPEKPKPTGKLDFSKAKTKPLKKEEEKPAKAEPKPKVAAASTIGDKVQAKMDESKRGTKRKSALASDSEEEEEKAVAKPASKPVAQAKSSSVRVRKGVVLSDDEDDAPQPTRKGKGKAVAESEAEKDLRAMMDIDDDAATVTRASRAAEPEPDPKSEDEDEGEGEPMEAIESDNAKPAPVKRKPKKVVPVGKNGLKKKRVVKSKSHIDDEGFMVMEDYSEYESVDEEEPAPAPKGKKKSTSKSASDAAPAPAKTKAAAAPKPKPAPAPAKSSKPKPSGGSGAAKSGQPTVASFFGKSKSK
ncbi:DNA polymerase subunit Cdc27 [Mycena olivaceomarginata]|nr:DNA polymerase subunit Cdc27 [Mycena olivaceomarginata]